MVEFVRGVGEGREVVFGSARSVVVVAFRPIAAARTCSLRSLPDLDLAADVVLAGVASLSLGELESLQKELKNCNQLTRETLLQCLSILPSGCMNRCIGNGCLGRCVEVGVPGCCIPG